MKRSQTLVYRSFEPLDRTVDGVPHARHAIGNIEQLIRSEQWDLARDQASALLTLALEGIHYLDTYHRTLMRTIVAVSYVGWMAYTALFVFRPLESSQTQIMSFKSIIDSSVLLVLIALWGVLKAESAPWTYFVYFAFPCYFWHGVSLQLVGSRGILLSAVWNWLPYGVSVVTALLAMVVS
jgi:GPI ethanolamine phosphate transferase 1